MTGVIRSDVHFQEHSNTLTHVTTQPTEDLILARNAELRKNPGSMHDLGEQSGESFGRWVANIPMIGLEWARRNGFDINNKDSKFASAEIHRFLTTTDYGRSCLVQSQTEGRGSRKIML